ncbi:hypothetical protein IV203_010363 [Nitzschia inconspicua]|uniref:BTB domain-containing protein n=1 Tax=Nitzschia inconspicua TaxID=303405 RepID=A0A9K3KXH1_9STRA|nr:hypothetical protein IV203_010363 [Nitzschia inconspicua]
MEMARSPSSASGNSSSRSRNRDLFRRSASKEMILGSIAETSAPVSPSNDTTTVASDDDDEEIDFQVRPLERRDRSFLNNSARGSSATALSVSSEQGSSSVRSFDKSKREKSLLMPRKLEQEVEENSDIGEPSPNRKNLGMNKDDFAHLLDHLVVAPQRSRSMVDRIRRKSSLREEAASNEKAGATSGTTSSRRSKSFVEQSSSLRKQWLQKSKSQVQAMLRSSSIKLPLDVDTKPSVTARREPRELSKNPTCAPQSIGKTVPSSSSSVSSTSCSSATSSPTASGWSSKRSLVIECILPREDLSREIKSGILSPAKPRSGQQAFRNPGSASSDMLTSRKPRSNAGRKSSKHGRKTKDLKEEMKRFLQNEGSIKEESDENDDDGGDVHDNDDASVRDSSVRSCSIEDSKRYLQPRRSMSRVLSMTKIKSNESTASSQQDSGPRRDLSRIQSIIKSDVNEIVSDIPQDSNEKSLDKVIEPSSGGSTTPTISNRKRASSPSPSRRNRPITKAPSSTPAKFSASSSDQSVVSDEGSRSSASNHSFRPRLSMIIRSSPFSKRGSSTLSVDMAGSVQKIDNLPAQIPFAPSSVGASTRVSLPVSGDKRRYSAPDLPVSDPFSESVTELFDEAFYASSHYRRTIGSRHLTWTTDRTDNFSDWILLIVRAGVSWETSNVDSYHIHKSVVGVGSRPSQLLLDQFDDQDSVFVRNTSSVELLSQAADLVPTMLNYIYDMKGGPLKITTATATALRHLADKFGVEAMFQEVNEFIRGDMNERTMDVYINDASLFKDKQLMQAALRLQTILEDSV